MIVRMNEIIKINDLENSSIRKGCMIINCLIVI